MKRRLLNLLTALSLLLCVAVCLLWVRSYSVSNGVLYGSASGEFGVQSVRGAVAFSITSRPHTPSTPSTLRWIQFGGPLPSVWQSPRSLPNRLGFGYMTQAFALPSNSAPGLPPVVQQRFMVVPLWFLVGAFAWLPLLRIYAVNRGRRTYRMGLCPRCGYDLRATPGRCPECGTTASVSTTG